MDFIPFKRKWLKTTSFRGSTEMHWGKCFSVLTGAEFFMGCLPVCRLLSTPNWVKCQRTVSLAKQPNSRRFSRRRERCTVTAGSMNLGVASDVPVDTKSKLQIRYEGYSFAVGVSQLSTPGLHTDLSAASCGEAIATNSHWAARFCFLHTG